MLVDLIGVAGLILILYSYLQKSIKTMYGLNSVGSIILGIYAFLLSSWVFLVLEIAIASITAYDYTHYRRKGKSKFFNKK